jgi:hypothetical protein
MTSTRATGSQPCGLMVKYAGRDVRIVASRRTGLTVLRSA